MNRFYLILVALLLAISLCACAGDTSTNLTGTTPGTQIDPNAQNNSTGPTGPHVHNYTGQQQSATCIYDGMVTYSCICGDSYTEKLYAIGHAFGDLTITEAPTMSKPGKGKRVCSSCKAEEFEEIPVRTLEQEVQAFMDDMMFGFPSFTSVDKLSGGYVFDWLTWHIPKVSWEMDENYVITIVYSIDDMDKLTQKYFNKTFDYTYLAEPNKDFMRIDMEKRQITVLTGGAGGNGYIYSIDALTDHGNGTYTARYYAYDPYVDETSLAYSHYGNIGFKIVDGHIQVTSHTKEAK